ncbi:hypothetical protein GUJ93_ZPchr0002g23797 [Zizania palustris]|uniref:PRA1 family protein n=1 Tax=Zizania palustris TaxID=103762 RepID=A0A8J5VCP4_ZIZPA|nr:hypothetical protein GUJ93_ZPchr0002g23797 [Zizania palustris]
MGWSKVLAKESSLHFSPILSPYHPCLPIDRGYVYILFQIPGTLKPVTLTGTAVLVYVCNLQFALVYAIGLSYAVMLLHASFRKLTPSSLPDAGNRNRRAQPKRR